MLLVDFLSSALVVLQVAHVVARHSAERMTRHLYLTLIQLFILAFLYAPDIVQALSVVFLELPFSRR